jgi:hypothetical protein
MTKFECRINDECVNDEWCDRAASMLAGYTGEMRGPRPGGSRARLMGCGETPHECGR